MKNKVFIALFIGFLIAGHSFSQIAQTTNIQTSVPDYEIKVKFKNLKDTVCFLGFNFGNNKYIRDTAKVNSKGIAIFKGTKPLEGGVYLIITPSKNFFEFIMTEKNISFETDTIDFVENMKVINSDENKVFYGYLKFMKNKHYERVKLVEELKLHQNNKDSSSMINAKIALVDSAVKNYRINIKKTYPVSFFTKILIAMDEPQAREKQVGENDTIYGKFLYNWYQNHFFDNIDFSDPRMLRTPIYEGKVNKFMEELTLKHPDSIKYAAERLIDKSMANDEMFKFTLIKLFNKYAQSKYMGQDAIFVYLAEKYYLSGLAHWTDTATLNKIYTEVIKKKSNLIGIPATNLIMKDTNDHYVKLFDIHKPYTILAFWDPECSHCRTIMPALVEWYKHHSKDSFAVYSVGVTSDRKKWISFMKEHHFNWIDVWDPANATNFRVLYDVFTTPVLYIIDSKKIIQAKKIGVEQIDELIRVIDRENKK